MTPARTNHQQRKNEDRYATEGTMELAVLYARLNMYDAQQRALMWSARKSRRALPEHVRVAVREARTWNRLIRTTRKRIRQLETQARGAA